MPKRTAARSAATGPRRLLDGLATVAAATLLAAVPLVWDVDVASAFRGPKSTLAGAAWALLAVLFAAGGGRAAWRDPWLLAWAWIVAGALASAPLSGEPMRVLAGTLPVALAGLGWMAVRQLPAPRRRRLKALLVGVGAAEAAVTLVFLVPALRVGSLVDTVAERGREAWIGTLGNPGDVAMFLVLPCLLAAARALDGGPRRAPLAGAALLMTVVVVGSQSLSGVAALVAGGAVLAGRRLAPRARTAGAVALLAAVGIAVLATPLRGRAATAVAQLRAGRWIWLGTGRAAGYAAALGMVGAHPITGAGFGLFEAGSFRFQTESTLADRARELGLVTGFGQAHNDLLQHLAETGLVGLALLAAGIWLAVRRSRGSPPPALPWRPLLAAAAVLGLLQFPLHIAAVAAQWAVLAALAVPPPPAAAPLGGAAGRARAGAAALLGLGVLVVAWQQHRADVALQQARLLVATLRTVPDRRVATEVARRGLAGLDRRRFWLPYSWDLEVTLGNLAMAGSEPAEAGRRFEAALALADRPEIRFDLGLAMLAIGDREGGLLQLDRAARLNPAILAQIADPGLRDAVLARLDADGYLARNPWVARRFRSP